MNSSLRTVWTEGFAELDEINALADGSPGFVWRLQTDEGNATSVRAYEDDLILFNRYVVPGARCGVAETDRRIR